VGKIKIFVEDNESQLEVEESLHKALEFHSSGDVHETELFEDAGAQDLLNKLELLHKNLYIQILNEIYEALDEDYTNGNI
jgi:hypothetical protein